MTDSGAKFTTVKEPRRSSVRLAGTDRRTQILDVATAQFALTGLHGTTTDVLAKAAGVSEPILYVHFACKESLYRAAIEANIENRLSSLSPRLAEIAPCTVKECLRSFAQATVAGYVDPASNSILTSWALLEAPVYAAELHRREISSVAALWERELLHRFPPSRLTQLSKLLDEFTISVCLAYGSWLASWRHTPDSAACLIRQFAAGIALISRASGRPANGRVSRSSGVTIGSKIIEWVP